MTLETWASVDPELDEELLFLRQFLIQICKPDKHIARLETPHEIAGIINGSFTIIYY